MRRRRRGRRPGHQWRPFKFHCLGRRAIHVEPAGGRQELRVRVLGADARLDRVTVDAQLVLLQRQRLAGGDAQLPLHQIQARDGLGHRVLDLQPRVHLHEEEAQIVDRGTARLAVTLATAAATLQPGFRHRHGLGDELHRAGAHIAHRLGRGHRRGPHLGAARFQDRGTLDCLL